jgi:hypothetical protein
MERQASEELAGAAAVQDPTVVSASLRSSERAFAASAGSAGLCRDKTDDLSAARRRRRGTERRTRTRSTMCPIASTITRTSSGRSSTGKPDGSEVVGTGSTIGAVRRAYPLRSALAHGLDPAAAPPRAPRAAPQLDRLARRADADPGVREAIPAGQAARGPVALGARVQAGGELSQSAQHRGIVWPAASTRHFTAALETRSLKRHSPRRKPRAVSFQ